MGTGRGRPEDIASFMVEQMQSEAPRKWEGREVLILVFGSGGYEGLSPLGKPSTAIYRRGKLNKVNEFGIYGVFRDDSEDPSEGTEEIFYSWGGVISIKSVPDTRS